MFDDLVSGQGTAAGASIPSEYNGQIYNSGAVNNKHHVLQAVVSSKVIELLISQYHSGATVDSIINVGSASLESVHTLAERLNESSVLHITNMTNRLIDCIDINIDIDKAMEHLNKVDAIINNHEVVSKLVAVGAPFQLVASLFNMQERQFAFIRQREQALGTCNLDNLKGGRPRKLDCDQVSLVQNSWNHYIRQLFNSCRYEKGDENFLIGDTILSIHQDTKIRILDFWPLIYKRISKVLATCDFTNGLIPEMALISDENMVALEPRKLQV